MYIDIFLAVFLLVGIIQGFHRGIIRTLFAIFGIVVGLIATLKFSPWLATFLHEELNIGTSSALVIAMILMFLVFMFLFYLLGRSFESTLKLVNLNFINKILGALLFAVLMLVTYSAIIWFLHRTQLVSDKQVADSKTYPVLRAVPEHTEGIVRKMKPVFKEFWTKVEEAAKPNTTEESPQ